MSAVEGLPHRCGAGALARGISGFHFGTNAMEHVHSSLPGNSFGVILDL